MVVLAGDIGGTNTRLAIYDVPPTGVRGLEPLFEQTYPSAAHASLDEIADRFLRMAADKLGTCDVESASFGIAGPIENNICRATNLPWVVDGNALSQRLGIARVVLVNDFHAAALGVTAVGPEQLVALGGDPPVTHGPMAVLGAGTGLGQAFDLVGSREPLPRDHLRGRARRPRRAHAAGARSGPVPDRQVRPRVVRAGPVRAGPGRRVHVPFE